MTNLAVPAAAEGFSTTHPATVEEAAVLDFQPWTEAEMTEDRFTPPSNEEWSELGRQKLPYVRLAFATMFKTKAELVEIISADTDMMMRLADDFQSTADTFEDIGRVQKLLEGAHARMMVAASVVAARGTAQ